MGDEVCVSFVIPHKGREKLLIDTIQSICLQDFSLDKIEIILVTQNEKNSNEINAFKSMLSLSIYHRPLNETIASLRNYGAGKSKGQYIAFIDADIFLSKNWLDSMISILLDDQECSLVSGIQKNSEQAPAVEQVRTVLCNVNSDHYVDFLPGSNLFLKKETFVATGGFPEHMKTCEDFFFTDKVNKTQGKLFCTSQANYIHLGEDKSYQQMFAKEIWRGQSNLTSIKGRKIPLSEWTSLLIPLAIFILLVLLIFSIVFAKGELVLAFLFLLSLPVMVYSLRLKKHAKHKVGLLIIMKFYLFYFPARMIGSIGGLFKNIGTKIHN